MNDDPDCSSQVKERAKKAFDQFNESVLLKSGSIVVAKVKMNHELEDALNKHDKKKIEALLKQGVLLNGVDNSGNTVLHLAMKSKNPDDMLELLLKVGDGIGTKLEWKKLKTKLNKRLSKAAGRTRSGIRVAANTLASATKFTACVGLNFIAEGTGNSVAAFFAKEEIKLKALSEDDQPYNLLLHTTAKPAANISLNQQNNVGETALHIAAQVAGASKDRCKSIWKLIELGANPNIRDREGRLPIYYALKNKNDLLQELFDKYNYDEMYGLDLQQARIYKIIESINKSFSAPSASTSTLMAGGTAQLQPVFLYGPHGVGKTMLAQSVAKQLGWKFILRNYDVSLPVHFKFALKNKPAVLYLDNVTQDTELDLIAKELGALGEDNKLFVIIGSHRLEELSGGKVGRFTRIEVPFPTPSNRRLMVKRFLDRLYSYVSISDEAINKVVVQTERFSGNDLRVLVEEVGDRVRQREGEFVNDQDLLSALKEQCDLHRHHIYSDEFNSDEDDVLQQIANYLLPYQELEQFGGNITLPYTASDLEKWVKKNKYSNKKQSALIKQHGRNVVLAVARLGLNKSFKLLDERAQKETPSGVSVEGVDEWGNTALHLAAMNKDGSIEDMIVACRVNGAKLDAKNKVGFTPLHVAIIHDNLSAIRQLLNLGADLNMQDNLGRTPLHLTAQYGRLISARLLHGRQCDLNLRDKEGQTALHLAVKHGHKRLVKRLLDYGISPIIRDNQGKVARYWATAHESTRRNSIDALLYSTSKNRTYRDFVGVDTIIATLKTIARNHNNAQFFGKVRTPTPLLFHGRMGTGKTELAKAFCKETNAEIFTLINRDVSAIENLFAKARAAKNAVVHIQNIERFSGTDLVQDSSLQLIHEMNNPANKSIVVIGETNNREKLNPKLKEIFNSHLLEFKLPDQHKRTSIISLLLGRIECINDDVTPESINAIAQQASGFTQFNLAKVVNDARQLALTRSDGKLSKMKLMTGDLAESIYRYKQSLPTTS